MSERRFYLCEVGDLQQMSWPELDKVITEAELKWRIAYIRAHDEGYEADIKTLLRGKEKGEFLDATA